MDKPRSEGWTWEKLGDSPGAKAASVVFIAIGALWAFAMWDEPIEEMSPDAPLQLVTSFGGVRLGQTLAAAASTLGPFDKEDQPQHVKKYDNEEDYRQRNGRLQLAVRDGVVYSIGYPCKERRDPTALNNVACHDSEDRIRKVLGDGVRVLCAKVRPDNKDLAPYARAYDAVEYGTRYVVIKDKVEGFIVTDPQELASLVGFNWVKCG